MCSSACSSYEAADLSTEGPEGGEFARQAGRWHLVLRNVFVGISRCKDARLWLSSLAVGHYERTIGLSPEGAVMLICEEAEMAA